MKDNISIIFTAIIGTFLIVLLPLYSILDRQDSMSYNVVLTETTNFVDSIRNNGFLDRDTYYNYISALATTANTYKVTIEAYRKTLIKDTDESGNIIDNSFVEEIELYNTQDILRVLEGETKSDTDTSDANMKDNVYLFDVNDEIYVKVYNTNMTAGSVIYNVIAGVVPEKVINVSYGGVINKINWELYDKVQEDIDLAPEVVMSVPVNSNNDTNITKIEQNSDFANIGCSIENLDDVIGETDLEELCGDLVDSTSLASYSYYYDLTQEKNRTIKVAVELRRFAKIDVGNEYIPISDLNETHFKKIISDYIQLNGMDANVSLNLRTKGDYYVFDITLTNVRLSILDYIYSFASITILPGLGMDENGVLSLGAETVQIELIDESAVHEVKISQPHNWKQFLKTNILEQSVIEDNTVYVNQEIFFVISYKGINAPSDSQEESNRILKQAIADNLKVYINEAEYSDIKIYTVDELNEEYGTNEKNSELINAGRLFVKFEYTKANNSKNNYIELLEGWIATNIDTNISEEQQDDAFSTYAYGAKSSEYAVLLDDVGPIEPSILLEGTKGNNDWYTSDVTLNLIASTSDQIKKSVEVVDADGNYIDQQIKPGGSGVYKNTVIIEGKNAEQEKEIEKIALVKEGISYAIAKAYDYIGETGNTTETEKLEIKIDKTAPTAPQISVSGKEGNNGWYTSEIVVEITPGKDNISGVSETKYRIEGANKLDETEGTKYTITKEGTSTFIATTWDNAGNKSESRVNISIDKSTPPDATIEVVEGQKNSPSTEWYYTDVRLKITVDASNSISGLGTSSYKINGKDSLQFVGNTQELALTENGVYEIIVTTSTVAGNIKETEYIVKIDKSAPNQPITDVTGTKGENNWYTSNVEIAVTPNGDVGTSGEKTITYKIITNGIEPNVEKEIPNNNIILLNTEGENKLIIYARDNALNKIQSEQVVWIDKTAPTTAQFILTGTKGNDDWYTSDVSLYYQGAIDDISGIQNVTLSHQSITENTSGTTVTLTTKDNAGHVVTKEQVIKIDKYAPSKPTININSEPTGTGIFGTLLYNKDVEVNIIPGVDTFLPNISNLDKTTYKVTRKVGETTEELVDETVINEGVTFTTEWEGNIIIESTTWDKAGNSNTQTTTLWIDKSIPTTPSIVSINGTNVEGVISQTINSTNNTVNLQINNLGVGNKVTITLINNETYENIVREITYTKDMVIQLQLENKGSYSIQVKQTNMYGTESGTSTGLYTYIYE